MRFKEIFVIAFLFGFVIGFSYYYNLENIGETIVCFEDNCFNVEVADTDEERQQGLMFREELDRNSGMLFVFENPDIYGFWMKNTLISLDIIWINEDKEVVFIGKEIQPCEEDPCPTTNPGENALYVLEINSGLSDEIGLEVESVLDFDIS